MTINPTLNGSLKIELTQVTDKLMLEHIVVDALADNSESLSEEFADLMIASEDWQEFVAPDIAHLFESQLHKIKHQLDKIGDGHEIYINKENSEHWYGAVNQARLQLEKQYKLSQIKENSDKSLLEKEQASALGRDEFYLIIQSLIIDYIWEGKE